MIFRIGQFLTILGLVVPFAWGGGWDFSQEETLAADRAYLVKLGFPIEAELLTAYLREKGKGNPTADELKKTFALLQSSNFLEHRQGLVRVASHGMAARPGLLFLESGSEGETKKRLQKALEVLGPEGSRIDGAVIRLLTTDYPNEALPALLAAYCEMDDESVVETARGALVRLSRRDGEFHPLLISALEDPIKKKRILALEILGQSGRKAPRDILRKKLGEKDPAVQWVAATALARQLDGQGFAALIDLLPLLEEKTALEAEDLLIEIAGDLAPQELLKRENSSGKNSAAWKTWWGKINGTDLVKELRDRIPNALNQEQIKKLIRELGDDQFEVREKAAGVLKTLGPQVVPALRSLLDSLDVEVRGRAKNLLAELGETGIKPIHQALPRLLVLKMPEGAAEALLDYLPVAENEEQASFFYDALASLAWQQGPGKQVPPSLLQDANPRRRVGAAVLCLNQDPKNSAGLIAPLLKDADPWVRFRVALFLAVAGQKDSLPPLIQSLGELTSEQCVDGEGLLFDLAGDNPPKALPSNPADRKKTSAAWMGWWEENSKKITLDAVASSASLPIYSGNVLIISLANNTVFELTKEGKSRWSITGLSGPMDAQLLPSGRILIAEHHAQRVSERNLKGEIVWKKDLGNNPLTARKVRGGVTSIVCRNKIIELDRQGNETFSLQRPQSDVMSAERLRDGSYQIVTNQMTCVKVDRAGKETMLYRLPFGVAGNANEFTRDGNVLVPLTWHNKIHEYDSTGQIVMEAQVTQPVTMLKLPNRNYLVSTQTLPPKLLEIDRSGKQVGERNATHPVFRIRYR